MKYTYISGNTDKLLKNPGSYLIVVFAVLTLSTILTHISNYLRMSYGMRRWLISFFRIWTGETRGGGYYLAVISMYRLRNFSFFRAILSKWDISGPIRANKANLSESGQNSGIPVLVETLLQPEKVYTLPEKPVSLQDLTSVTKRKAQHCIFLQRRNSCPFL